MWVRESESKLNLDVSRHNIIINEMIITHFVYMCVYTVVGGYLDEGENGDEQNFFTRSIEREGEG